MAADRRPAATGYATAWRWHFYAGLFILIGNASLLDVVAFAITPLSLIAPFAGMTIVFTLLLAACGCVGVHERPPRDAMTAIALVVTGVTAAAIFHFFEYRKELENFIRHHTVIF